MSDAAFTALRERYRRILPGKLQDLAHAVRGARQSPGEPAQLGEARDIAHTLSGTTGSYRFLALSEVLRRIVRLIEDVPSTSAEAALHDGWEEVDRALRETSLLLDVPGEGF